MWYLQGMKLKFPETLNLRMIECMIKDWASDEIFHIYCTGHLFLVDVEETASVVTEKSHLYSQTQKTKLQSMYL